MATAERLARAAANNGNSYGLFVLGYLYFTGGPTLPRDLKQALTYYNLAADQGNLFALCNLGFMYQVCLHVVRALFVYLMRGLAIAERGLCGAESDQSGAVLPACRCVGHNACCRIVPHKALTSRRRRHARHVQRSVVPRPGPWAAG